ncbi:MAG: hypothetical protein LH654_11740 [Thermoleophilia bacterium]|nr:hypothetical protein [Thermoleophilia bacterium]
MTAYTFLSEGRTSLFTGVVWPPPGEWLAGREVRATTVDHLVPWIDDELWVCELSEPVSVGAEGEILTAERARLGERIVAWDEAAADDLTAACVARACTHAVDAVRRNGSSEAEALSLLGASEFASAATAVASRLPEGQREVVLFAADVVALSRGRRPEEYETPPDPRGAPTSASITANVAYVTAHVAGTVHPGGYDAGVAAERAWQLAWLRERLGIAEPST